MLKIIFQKELPLKFTMAAPQKFDLVNVENKNPYINAKSPNSKDKTLPINVRAIEGQE